MAAKKGKHGGARPGSGRPRTDSPTKTVKIGVTIPGSIVADVDTIAATNEMSRSAAVTQALRDFIVRWLD